MAHQLPKKACMSSIIYLKAQENQIRDEKKEKKGHQISILYVQSDPIFHLETITKLW